MNEKWFAPKKKTCKEDVKGFTIVSLGLALVLIVMSGCSDSVSTPEATSTTPVITVKATATTKATQPSVTVEATRTPTATPPSPTAEPQAYQQVDVPQVGLAFEVPHDWQRLEPELAWMPKDAGNCRLGFNWMDIQPPMEAEAAMLPNHSQTIQSNPVELSWGKGRLFTVEVYAPAAQGGDTRAPVQSVETHIVIVVSQENSRRAFDFYASGPTAGQLDILEPSLQHMLNSARLAGAAQSSQTMPEVDPVADWQMFHDEKYGFQFKYPPDWTYKELDTKGPGTPDDWPVERVVTFFPQVWEAQLNRSGPPDPTAPVVVAPLSLEVCVGPMDQFRRAYPVPAQSESQQLGKNQVTIEQEINDPIRLTRYVFRNVDSNQHIVFADLISGFPDRVKSNKDFAELVPLIVATFEFNP